MTHDPEHPSTWTKDEREIMRLKLAAFVFDDYKRKSPANQGICRRRAHRLTVM